MKLDVFKTSNRLPFACYVIVRLYHPARLQINPHFKSFVHLKREGIVLRL